MVQVIVGNLDDPRIIALLQTHLLSALAACRTWAIVARVCPCVVKPQ